MPMQHPSPHRPSRPPPAPRLQPVHADGKKQTRLWKIMSEQERREPVRRLQLACVGWYWAAEGHPRSLCHLEAAGCLPRTAPSPGIPRPSAGGKPLLLLLTLGLQGLGLGPGLAASGSSSDSDPSPGRETDSLRFSPLPMAPPCLRLLAVILRPLVLHARLWLHVLLAHRSLSWGHPKLHTYLQDLSAQGQGPLLALALPVITGFRPCSITCTPRQRRGALQVLDDVPATLFHSTNSSARSSTLNITPPYKHPCIPATTPQHPLLAAPPHQQKTPRPPVTGCCEHKAESVLLRKRFGSARLSNMCLRRAALRFTAVPHKCHCLGWRRLQSLPSVEQLPCSHPRMPTLPVCPTAHTLTAQRHTH